jgi:hypothetical protein
MTTQPAQPNGGDAPEASTTSSPQVALSGKPELKAEGRHWFLSGSLDDPDEFGVTVGDVSYVFPTDWLDHIKKMLSALEKQTLSGAATPFFRKREIWVGTWQRRSGR